MKADAGRDGREKNPGPAMSEIVNLNRARKAKARAEAQATAAANRVKFGRPKSETKLEKARREKAARDLDANKRQP
jgi:hypothetical protein